jgi:isopentenyl diphosphate isomerase/L-lactate dehydrogenase-like FMN-dependent dehydrogenase
LAVVVSNYGGLVLDGSPSSLSVLPSIVAAIGHTRRFWSTPLSAGDPTS